MKLQEMFNSNNVNWEFAVLFFLKEDQERKLLNHFILYEQFPKVESVEYNKKEIIEEFLAEFLKGKSPSDLDYIVVDKNTINVIDTFTTGENKGWEIKKQFNESVVVAKKVI